APPPPLPGGRPTDPRAVPPPPAGTAIPRRHHPAVRDGGALAGCRRALSEQVARCRLQRLALPPHELRPGRHQRAPVPENHGHARGPLDAVRDPTAAAVVVPRLGERRTHLLPR